jgi:ABC-2 type transport system ATP-binding protein
MSANALEIRGLEKSFSSFKLGPLDLTVPLGAIYGFVGPNGAGKTTTIDLIFGLGMEDAGTISVMGLDHRRDEKAMKLRTGYVGPELNHSVWGRVSRLISFVKGFYPTWDDAYCTRLLDEFGIDPSARVMSLSFGTKIKLSLVLALSWRPTLLVLDEPTVGLDAISKRQVFAELLAAVRDGDRAVFISSHAITDLERFADHVGMIKAGKLLFEGPVTDIVERYRLVDLSAEQAVRIADEAGVLVQDKDGSRWRLLLDRERMPVERLAQLGVTPLADSGLTLEELFIALGRPA